MKIYIILNNINIYNYSYCSNVFAITLKSYNNIFSNIIEFLAEL